MLTDLLSALMREASGCNSVMYVEILSSEDLPKL